MKLFVKLMIFVLVLAVAAPYVMKGKDGKPIMQLELPAFISDLFKSNSGSATTYTSTSGKDGSDGLPVTSGQVYKWKDEKGRWQFSDKPVDGKKVTTHIIPKSNISVPVKVPGKEDEEKEVEKAEPEKASGIPLPMSVQDVPKLIENANNVQKLLDDRQSQLQKQTGR